MSAHILCGQRRRSIAHYADSLGFALGWTWSDDRMTFLECEDHDGAALARGERGAADIALAQRPKGKFGSWVHIDTNNIAVVDRPHEEWRKTRALVTEPPRGRPWGLYEMDSAPKLVERVYL